MKPMASEPHAPRIDRTTGRWFTRWWENGRSRGKKFGHSDKVSKGEVKRLFNNWLIRRKFAKPSTGNAVAGIILSYNEHAVAYYRRADHTPTGEHVNIYHALKPLGEIFGKVDADELRPHHLEAYVQQQIAANTARSTINKRLGIIKRMYRWAGAQGFVRPDTVAMIAMAPTIAAGRTAAKEVAPVEAVPLRHVAMTMRHLPPVLCAMIRLQWLTGMRPGEVCNLTAGQIDRTRATWLYVPAQHKNAHRQKPRVIALGPKARRVLMPYLFRGASAAMFTPSESRRWWNEQRRILAVHRSPEGRLRVVYKVNERFTAKTYGDAIERACVKAKVPAWTPNQIRHSAATKTAHAEGRETAKRLLGHANVATTAIYISEDIKLLMERAERAG